MRKLLLILGIAIVPASFSSCDVLQGSSGPSQDEIISGLKEALSISTDTSVVTLNKANGYFSNAAIKILLPPEAQKIESTLRSVPGIGNALVDELILKMNKAAEQAAVKAGPIFKDAIMKITFADVMNILNGPEDAATKYLKDNTYTQLQGAFQPPIEDALKSVGAQQAWNTVMTTYNNYNNFIPGTTDIPDNLASHCTTKALDGLFLIVAQEEAKIRKNIGHQVTDLLKKVFGPKQDGGGIKLPGFN
jgi:hypothetical protein